MIFHSFDFLVFFLAVFAAYWALPGRIAQNALLLGASYFFYGYVHPWFVLLIGTTTLVDFWCARAIVRWPGRKRGFLVLSLCASLGMLGFFKYYGFFVANVAGALEAAGLGTFTSTLHIFLPVGISFYTFQSISYVVDVYRGHLAPARSLLDYALYVSFFPQLVAGPIERSGRLLPQMQQARAFCPERARGALVLIAWGFFKKLAIADNVGITCDKVFALEAPPFPVLWAGVFAFAIQIFADFSAYTDIARGTARLLGFDLMENFRHPYLSRSPSEFWQRWHISLSTWFRDYVFIPLGGSRAGAGRTAFNLVFTFFLSGLWHGAQWNFVFWALWYALLLLVYRGFAAIVPERVRTLRWLAPLQWLAMFALINVGWLMFRETDLHFLLAHLKSNPFTATGEEWAVAGFLFSLILVYSVPIWLHHASSLIPEPMKNRVAAALGPRGLFIAQTLLACLCFCGILLFRSETTADFIYFQF